jgi:hypothetical protein
MERAEMIGKSLCYTTKLTSINHFISRQPVIRYIFRNDGTLSCG